jgi:CRISPR-associated protein Csy2
MNESLDGLILLPRLNVQNANAISGPFTWGFPAPTAFTGFVHALQRKVQHEEVYLDGVGIVCHRFSPLVSSGWQHTFALTRNPIGPPPGTKFQQKNGKVKIPGIVQEGRVQLDVSLLLGVHGYLAEDERDFFVERVSNAIQRMRIAGGSILPGKDGLLQPEYCQLSGNAEEDRQIFRGCRRNLLPGFALISRERLLVEHWREMRKEDAEADQLDALLDLIALHVDSIESESGEVDWQAHRRSSGWLVPLPVGYAALTPAYSAGEVRNARDNTKPFRFVESMCSLGEWVSPHRLEYAHEMLWYHEFDKTAGLYTVKHRGETKK